MAARNVQSPHAILHFLAQQVMNHSPLLVMLATCEDDVACVRTVVLRGCDEMAGTLWLSSHAHAVKVAHLRKHPLAEMVAWFPDERIQLRLRARWDVIDAVAARASAPLRRLRTQAWQSHSPASRQIFTRHAPGQPVRMERENRPAIAGISADRPAAHFAILAGQIKSIDVLQILQRRQRRYLHQRTEHGWREQAIAP